MSNINNRIPKVIHLCWFSGDEYPNEIQMCISSWAKNLHDYKIKIWTKEMALNSNIPYVKEAISVKKWAFAADVIRLYALYNEGGIYMDSDIAVRQRFDDFMTNELVLFQEYHSFLVKKSKRNNLDINGYNLNIGQSVDGIGIQAAFMMSIPKHPFIKTLLKHYEDRHFINKNGRLDTDIIAPAVYAGYAEKLGYRYADEIQHLNNITIYPSKHIAGSYFEIYDESIALHCCSHSWYDPNTTLKIKNYIKSLLNKIRGTSNRNNNIDIITQFLNHK